MSPLSISEAVQEPRGKSLLIRTSLIAVCGLVVVLVIIGRLLQIQIIEHQVYDTRSINNRIETHPISPPRGLVFDRNGVLIAENTLIQSLAIIPERVEDLDELLDELRKRVDISDAQVDRFRGRVTQRRRPYDPVALKDVLSDSEQATLAVDRYRLPGVVVAPETVRSYPFGALTAHAIGSVRRITVDDLNQVDEVRYSGTDFIGRLGIEKFYETSLHGEVGYRTVEVDAHGRVMKTVQEQQPIIGTTLTLHLDLELQTTADAALGNRRGAVVAIDPQSGGIMALVSKPSYDPNEFVLGIRLEQLAAMEASRVQPLFNRAINGTYAPGSTFKPVIALAALDNDVIGWEDTIEDKGEFQLPGSSRVYRGWSWTKGNPGGQGICNLTRAIYRSSNIYFYDVATRLGIDSIANYARRFAFGEATVLDIPDVESGNVPNDAWKRERFGERWYPGDTVNLAIGQGYISVTPLQLATYATVLANRGRWVQPRMLRSSSRALPELPALMERPLVSDQEFIDEHWERLVQAMQDVVHLGNQDFGNNGIAWAHIGMDIAYTMAGKSGTAQVVEIAQGEAYDEELLDEFQRKHALFIAFAPVSQPRIAVAVVVENGGGGSSVAGPVAREVIDNFLLKRRVADSG